MPKCKENRQTEKSSQANRQIINPIIIYFQNMPKCKENRQTEKSSQFIFWTRQYIFLILNNMKDSDQLLPKEEGTGFEQN